MISLPAAGNTGLGQEKRMPMHLSTAKQGSGCYMRSMMLGRVFLRYIKDSKFIAPAYYTVICVKTRLSSV